MRIGLVDVDGKEIYEGTCYRQIPHHMEEAM